MKTKPLKQLKSSTDGYAMSLSVLNQIIERIEDLVEAAESQKPIAGDGIQINYTREGSVINISQ